MALSDRTEPPMPDAPESDGADAVPWARQPVPPRQRSTSRARRIAEGLPDWEPMPPGEFVIRRPGQG